MAAMPPAGTLLEGDRYRVVAPLGAGGMGAVVEGFDERLRRPVAIKLVDDRDPTAAQRLRAEAHALARLHHPHVVAVFDTGVHDGRPFVVTELVEGRTLRRALDEGGPLPAPVVAELGVELADALACAHEHGVVHRDVTPTNVLLGDDGRARLIDFGIAVTTPGAALTATGTVIGTPAYLAPEQVEGRRAGPASDVYALGLVLAEAVSGTRVFAGTLNEVAMARLTTDAPLPPMAPAWRAALAPLVRRRPEERPPMASVARALGALRHPVMDTATTSTSTVAPVTTPQTAPQAHPPPASAPPGAAPRRRGVLVGLAAALVVVVAALLAVAVAGVGGDPDPVGGNEVRTEVSTTVPVTTAAPSTTGPSTTTPPTTAPTTTATEAGRDRDRPRDGPRERGPGGGRGRPGPGQDRDD